MKRQGHSPSDRAANPVARRLSSQYGSGTSTINVKKYLHQLRQKLPYVPPISEGRLIRLCAGRDFEGMVRAIKTTMNVEARLIVGWVNSGGPKSAPAWVQNAAQANSGAQCGSSLRPRWCFRVARRMLLTSVSDDAGYDPRERQWSGQRSYSRRPFDFPAP
jgi:hypothetical protein